MAPVGDEADRMFRNRSLRGVVLGTVALALAAVLVPAPTAVAIPPFPIVDDTTGTPGELNEAWDRAVSGVDNPGGTYTGDGWMRLTDNRGNLATSLLWDVPFPATTGFTIDVDYRQAGGNQHCQGAAGCRTGDGMSVYLVDGAVDVSPGAFGGGLGYAGNEVTCGVVGGYMGIGLDVYGNYARPTAFADGGPGVSPSTLGIRGSGTQPCDAEASYPWIDGAPVPGLWTGVTGSTADPADVDGSLYRHLRVVVLPQGDSRVVTVYLSAPTPKEQPYGALTEVLQTDIASVPGQVDPAPTLKLGFGASTGGATNFHDIRDIRVTALADASITKSLAPGTPGRPDLPPGTFLPGDPVSFVVTATNEGPTAIGDPPDGVARVLDDLSDLPIADVAWTCTPVGDAECVTPGGTGPVVQADWVAAAGSGVQLLVTGTVAPDAPPADYANEAVVPTDFDAGTVGQDGTPVQLDGGATDPDTSNNTATLPFAVAGPLFAQTKTAAPAQVAVGQPVTYTVTVRNDGLAPGTATLLDTPPGTVAVTEATCSASADGVCTVAVADGTVTGTLGLDPGQEATFVLTGTAQAVGDATNAATVTPTTPGCATGCGGGSATAVADVLPTSLALTKSATADGLPVVVLSAGSQVDYTYEVVNTGQLPLEGLTVVETDFTGAGTLAPPTCALTRLEPGEGTTCTTTYVVQQEDVDAGGFVNAAVAEATAPASTVVTRSAEARLALPVPSRPALALTKTATVVDADADGRVSVGDTVEWRFVVANTGNATLADVAVADATAGPVTCASTTLLPAATTTCTAPGHVVTAADAARGHVRNTATASATDPLGTVVESAPSTVTVPVAAPSGPPPSPGPAPGPGSSSGPLPRTGADLAAVAGLGAAFVVAGVLLVLRRRSGGTAGTG